MSSNLQRQADYPFGLEDEALLQREQPQGSGNFTPDLTPGQLCPMPGPDQELIMLTRGYHTIVDEKVVEQVRGYKWHAARKDGKVYAARRTRIADNLPHIKTIYLHRQLANVLDDPTIVIDHKNGNGLVNVLGNLRPCNHAGNMQNLILGESRDGEQQSSTFRGVHVYPSGARQYGKCLAYFNFMGKRYYCGTFSAGDQESAAQARDVKVVELLGHLPVEILNNVLNFPLHINGVPVIEEIPF